MRVALSPLRLPSHLSTRAARRKCGEARRPSARAGAGGGRRGCHAARARARGTAGDAGLVAAAASRTLSCAGAAEAAPRLRERRARRKPRPELGEERRAARRRTRAARPSRPQSRLRTWGRCSRAACGRIRRAAGAARCRNSEAAWPCTRQKRRSARAAGAPSARMCRRPSRSPPMRSGSQFAAAPRAGRGSYSPHILVTIWDREHPQGQSSGPEWQQPFRGSVGPCAH